MEGFGWLRKEGPWQGFLGGGGGQTEAEREDKKLQWQITLASEKFMEEQKLINERITRTEGMKK